MTRKLGIICLAVWLILYGLLAVTNFRFDLQNVIMGILAVVAGVLILLDK